MNSVNGLQAAVKLYYSEKVRERSQGLESIREIFSNSENINVFQETASREGGAGWVAFFQCLFHVVKEEKQTLQRKKTGTRALAERRLTDAVALVRFVAERVVSKLSRKPFIALFAHMTTFLVQDGHIYQPVAVDYAKALRSLLSFPPHLAHLDRGGWRSLMAICWAAVLGDRVSNDSDWDDEPSMGDEDEREEDEDEPKAFKPPSDLPASIMNEIASLIPLLLTSANAPLIPPSPPASSQKGAAERAVGHSILLKIHRYLVPRVQFDQPILLDIARALNLVLTELELNCKDLFTSASIKLFPKLVSIWTARNKGDLAVREHILVAMRIMLPFVTHSAATNNAKEADAIKESTNRILDSLPKEAGSRGAIKPVELDTLRFMSAVDSMSARHEPFRLATLAPGFGFDATQAINWAVIELYADCCFHTYDSVSTISASAPTQTQRRKRQRVDSSLDKLLSTSLGGIPQTRLLACQVLVFLLDRHYNDIHGEARDLIRNRFLDLLDDENGALQSWSFIGLSFLAAIEGDAAAAVQIRQIPVTPAALASRRKQEQSAWEKLWKHGLLKLLGPVSRPACYAVNMVLKAAKVDHARCVRDVHSFLRTIDVQGPPVIVDTACSLLITCLSVVRSDAGLYSANLEDKVLDWAGKTLAVDGVNRSRMRMGSATPVDVLNMFTTICGFSNATMSSADVFEHLPDCPIVNRAVYRSATEPIRRLILEGIIPTLEQDQPQATADEKFRPLDVDSLAFLEGRPRKLSDILKVAIDNALQEWAPSDRPSLVTAERLRKSIDLAILALTFQGAIQINGLRPDSSGCLRQAVALLETLVPQLRVLSSDNVPAQLLVWRGFAPLYHGRSHKETIWPIMLKPDAASGIRRDILPSNRYDGDEPEELKSQDDSFKILAVVWTRPEAKDVLGEIINISKSMLEGVRAPGGATNGFNRAEDDDFEPIVNADNNELPQSYEAAECQRSMATLLKTLVDIRLRGPMLATSDLRPTRDVALLNTWLTADGSRFLPLGFVICDAISDGSLRLGIDAAELIIEELWIRLEAYAFRRDSEMLRLAIVFLARLATMWLSEQSGLTETAIHLARALVSRAENGTLSSWNARLHLLLFIDEYLDYDPAFSAWLQWSDTEQADVEMGGTGHDPLGPLAFILDSMSDSDARVRMRAISDAAAVHYLPDLPSECKAEAYYELVHRQSSADFVWDHMFTNLLWKLNTCIASARLRAAAIFHVYEVAEHFSVFLPNLEQGLNAVASRLGLESLKPLFIAHAYVIVPNQVACELLPMRLPPSVYGCSTRREFATITLDVVGAKFLSQPEWPSNAAFFAQLCDAAHVEKEQATKRHLPIAAALAVCAAVSEPGHALSMVEALATKALASLNTEADDFSVEQLLSEHGEYIVANLFSLVNLSESNAAVAALLKGVAQGAAAEIFLLLVAHGTLEQDPPSALDPSFPAMTILQAHAFFRGKFKVSRRRVVFDAMVRLFFLINESFLVNEQQRYLRSLALLVSLYPGIFALPVPLKLFLQNLVELLTTSDIGAVALSMLEWGFQRLDGDPHDKRQPQIQTLDLSDLLVKLGTARTKLRSMPTLQSIATQLDEFVARSARAWQASPVLRPALTGAILFWPSEFARHFDIGDSIFTDVVAVADRPNISNPMALCNQLANLSSDMKDKTNRETFLSSTFWQIKKNLGNSQWDRDGANAFLNLLYQVDGDVHAPSLDAIQRLTGRINLADLAKKHTNRPDNALRILVLDKVFEQTGADDCRLRTTAYKVLQSALPLMQEMASQGGMTSALRETMEYLVPMAAPATLQEAHLDVLIDEASGWIFKTRTYPVWTKDLALLLGALAATDDPFYLCLQPVLSAKGAAASELLPYLVQAVLTCGATEHPEETSQRAAILSNHFTQVLQFPSAAPASVEAVINIVLHLRNFRPPYDATSELGYNNWLSVEPLVLSEAAGRCGAFASSLLFLEMAKDRDEHAGDQNFNLGNSRVQKVMYDIYSNVEDPDGFYGIQNSDVMDALHRRLDHESKPLTGLGYNLAGFEASPASTSTALVSALRNLHDLGFDSLAGTVMKSIRRDGATQQDTDPFFLELAWRMGDWDVPVTEDLKDTSTGRFYTALRAVHRERDREVARCAVDIAINAEMSRLQHTGIERMTEVKKTVVNLVCLHEVARWTSVPMQNALDQGDFEGHRLSSFVDLSPSLEFTNAERLSATRLSLLRSARARESKTLLGDLMSTQSEGLVKLEGMCQLRLSQLARKELNLQAAVNAITAVRQLEQDQPSDAAEDEFGQVLWAKSEHSLAIQHIERNIVALDPSPNWDSPKDNASTARLALLLGRMSNWRALAKLRSASENRVSFRRAMQLGDQSKAVERAHIAHDFAVFCDQYFETLARSPERERLVTFVDRKKGELQRLDQSIRSSPGSSRHKSVTDQELEDELKKQEQLEDDMVVYLVYALQSYAGALRDSDDYDDSMTRMCSLWLEHHAREDTNRKFTSSLELIPTRKFIFLGPQLAARLYRPPGQMTTFNANLNNTMRRLARDHPYHILYQIITLAHGAPANAGRSRAGTPASQEGRGAAASEILASLEADADRPLAAEAAKLMSTFAKAAVSWCYFKSASAERARPNQEAALPSNCSLLQIRNFKIPVATVIPPVDYTMAYNNVPTINRYRSKFKVAGGVHRPSINTVVDTLGHEHIQLFKGDDEVRQDAVMEQVFEMTNRLLSRDRRASVRNLTFRTYNVVPLMNRSGIIEFVGETMAIGEWLKDAHVRYRVKQDITGDMFRRNIGKIQEQVPEGNQKMVNIFKQQMESFHPVMRHFFTEKRREPLAWFTMRLNYARSVAVTSMVGYMVGLGDRHCSNILIDKVTGELVHIDFGIVFEEGRKLRVPEKVPFRLTNDIVDGLGITGVDGTFRQCSEHTLRVLREHAELILTVLEVFKHDPLYAWTGDPGKLKRAGGGKAEPQQNTTGQDKAERVLGRIREKLLPELSVEYTVNYLIQEARNPDHLARIFVGWQPWL